MAAVAALCTRAILLKSGQLQTAGNSAAVIDAYMAGGPQAPGELICDASKLGAVGSHVRLAAARTTQQGAPTANVMIDSPLTVELDFEVLAERSRINAHLQLFDGKGACVCVLCSPSREFARGLHRQSVEFPENFFNDGVYRFNILLLRNETEAEVTVNDALIIEAQEAAARDESWNGIYWGCIRPKLDWRITEHLPATQL